MTTLRPSFLLSACTLVALLGQLAMLALADVGRLPRVTAILGQRITLPCNITDEPYAVFWHQHTHTGAPFQDSRLVAQFFPGPTENEPRFSMTLDYALVISNVSALDETTYSCQVAYADATDDRSSTDVKVKALANPINPIILGCDPIGGERCSYHVGTVDSESFDLTCEVNLVRPVVNLTWKRTNGGALTQDKPEEQENDNTGLFSISRIVKVSKVLLEEELTCEASGEAVGGSSSTTVSFSLDVSSESVLGIVGIIIGAIVLIAFIGTIIIYCKYNNRERDTTGDTSNAEMTPLRGIIPDDIEILKKKILNHHPEKLGTQETQSFSSLCVKAPSKVHIGIFGVEGSGKSTFVGFLLYGMKGEKEILNHTTPVTDPKGKWYNITRTIKIKDNQGVCDLRKQHVIGSIMKTIERDNITCPVIIHSVKGLISENSDAEIEDLGRFISELSGELSKVFDDRPMLIISLQDEITVAQDRELREKLKRPEVHPSRLRFIGKADWNDVEDGVFQEKRLEYLKLLQELVVIADSNLTYKRKHRKHTNT